MQDCGMASVQVSDPERLQGMQDEQRRLFERREAEQLLCILAVLDALLFRLEKVEERVAADLGKDLFQLINKHPYIQVLPVLDSIFETCLSCLWLSATCSLAGHLLGTVRLGKRKILWITGCRFCLQGLVLASTATKPCCCDTVITV
jgi:hypothetical protein